jgi:ATP-dependent Clp protease protease subunit
MRVYYEGCNVQLKAKQEDVADLPIVIRVNKFDEETSLKFAHGISIACQRRQPVLPIVIDSFGGSCYDLLTMVNQLKDVPMPVATIVEGKAMSAGAFLFGCGTNGYRYASPDATIMLHEIRGEILGKNADMKANSRETDRINKLLFATIAKNCGKPANYFLDIIRKKNNTDWYMTPIEAKKHGLVNHVKVPEYKTSIEVKYVFG